MYYAGRTFIIVKIVVVIQEFYKAREKLFFSGWEKKSFGKAE